MGYVGLFYGSEWGSTERVAKLVKQELDAALRRPVCDLHDVKDTPVAALEEYRCLIFGVPTADGHQMQHDWQRFAKAAAETDLSDRALAMFGLGDQKEFPNHFVDALGILDECMRPTRAVRIGTEWPVAGYRFQGSRALRERTFVGLVIDQDTQADLTNTRVQAWVRGLVKELRDFSP